MSVPGTIEQVIERSRKRGLAAQPLYAIFSTPVDGWDPVVASSDAHLAYLGTLEAEGKLFGAGPLGVEESTQYDSAGLIIVRAGSLEEAREIAAGDPMHTSGARTFRIRPWVLNEGAITFTARLSKQEALVR